MKFKVTFEQKIFETYEVEVEAENAEQAKELVSENPFYFVTDKQEQLKDSIRSNNCEIKQVVMNWELDKILPKEFTLRLVDNHERNKISLLNGINTGF